MGKNRDLNFLLNEAGNPGHVARERDAARVLRKSRWWQNLIQKSECHYCKAPLNAKTATMDHVVPVSSGGRSTPGNVVPACKPCNTRKRDHSHLDLPGMNPSI